MGAADGRGLAFSQPGYARLPHSHPRDSAFLRGFPYVVLVGRPAMWNILPEAAAAVFLST